MSKTTAPIAISGSELGRCIVSYVLFLQSRRCHFLVAAFFKNYSDHIQPIRHTTQCETEVRLWCLIYVLWIPRPVYIGFPLRLSILPYETWLLQLFKRMRQYRKWWEIERYYFERSSTLWIVICSLNVCLKIIIKLL